MTRCHPQIDGAGCESRRQSNCTSFVRGELSERLLAAFPDLQATKRQGETILVANTPVLFGVWTA
jgi:hypothetical protein